VRTLNNAARNGAFWIGHRVMNLPSGREGRLSSLRQAHHSSEEASSYFRMPDWPMTNSGR
jgi:hypothetical protein